MVFLWANHTQTSIVELGAVAAGRDGRDVRFSVTIHRTSCAVGGPMGGDLVAKPSMASMIMEWWLSDAGTRQRNKAPSKPKLPTIFYE